MGSAAALDNTDLVFGQYREAGMSALLAACVCGPWGGRSGPVTLGGKGRPMLATPRALPRRAF